MEEPIDSNIPSVNTKTRSIPRCVILHYSPFKAVWDWVTLLLVVYTAFSTPYITAFLLHDDHSKAKQNLNPALRSYNAKASSVDPLVIVDVIIDLMFLVDILINFRTTFLFNGDVISDPQKIAINYIKSWFLVDALAAIPFDLLLFGTGTSSTATLAGILKISRLLRLIRVAKKVDQFSEYGAAVLLMLLAIFVLISHWLACIFYVIAFLERPSLHAPIGWLDHLANVTGRPFLKNDTLSGPDMRSKYITSLYFTYTILTTVGFGNISPITNAEKVFSIFAMLLGSLMSAVIFGNVSSIMLRIYQGSGEQQELEMSIREFIRFHSIPKNLAKRLLESNEQSKSFANGIDMNSVLKSFPECLQADICLHLNRNLLNKCEAFSEASQGCIRVLSMKFKSTHAPPGDTLIHPGDVLNSIYFIARGSIEICLEGFTIAVLNKDDSFGQNFASTFFEEGVWKPMKKSLYSVKIVQYSDMHKISVQDLRKILNVYPEFSCRFLEKFQVTFDISMGIDEQPNTNFDRKHLDRRLEDSLAKRLASNRIIPGSRSHAEMDSILVLSPLSATTLMDTHHDDDDYKHHKKHHNIHHILKVPLFGKKYFHVKKHPEEIPLIGKQEAKQRKANDRKNKRKTLKNKIISVNQRLINLRYELFHTIDSILFYLGHEPSVKQNLIGIAAYSN